MNDGTGNGGIKEKAALFRQWGRVIGWNSFC
jgi:hypothetical protein